MSYIRRAGPMDLLSLNLTNLDPLTENYDIGFYLNYLMRWPSLFSVVQDRDAGIVGYSKSALCNRHNWSMLRKLIIGQHGKCTG